MKCEDEQGRLDGAKFGQCLLVLAVLNQYLCRGGQTLQSPYGIWRSRLSIQSRFQEIPAQSLSAELPGSRTGTEKRQYARSNQVFCGVAVQGRHGYHDGRDTYIVPIASVGNLRYTYTPTCV